MIKQLIHEYCYFHKGILEVLFKKRKGFRLDVDRLNSDVVPNWYKVPASTVFNHRGIGVVIGAGVKLGENVFIGQNVIIGQRGSGDTSYPTIEDNVTIYANASILGGITIGHGSVVGAGAVVINDIPPRSLVAGVPAKVVKKNLDYKLKG